MSEMELVQWLCIFLGIPVGFFVIVVAICVALFFYPKFKLVFGDLLRVFGGASKWIRRKSVALEFEGTINSFAEGFNSDATLPLLPQCSVEWVTGENVQSFITPGKAIVKLSFSHDHDQNFYNAASSFIDVGVLPRAKAYLDRTAARAIDLLMLKNLLARSRRSALNIFNLRFRDEMAKVKERYRQCEETDAKGLFKRIALQEYHLWAEALGEKVPDDILTKESEDFWEWFYGLATRQPEENSELSFRSQHLNMGVILIAHSDTYEKYGRSPYVRRAFTYAASDCQCIYLVSRGRRKSRIVKDIAKELIGTGCFECLTRKADVETYAVSNETPVLVTCIALKPSQPDIVNRAWQEIRRAKQSDTPVLANIRAVFQAGVSVDIVGLRVQMGNEKLSALRIQDARKYFAVNEDLLLKVEQCDQTSSLVLLSNVDTETDPKRMIERFEGGPDVAREATIERILVSGEGWETGLLVAFPGEEVKGYIPRDHATFSRFQKLSEIYCEGSHLNVRALRFDARFRTFVCRVDALEDPWATIAGYKEGDQIKGIVRQISQHYIVCEPFPGIEGRIPFDEISWGTEDEKTEARDQHRVGENVAAVVIEFDADRKKLTLSLKRLTHSPVYEFFNNHQGCSMEAKVIQVTPSYALLGLGPEQVTAYLHVSEAMWNYCTDLTEILTVGEALRVKLTSYDNSHDNIRVSLKATYPNDFEAFETQHHVDDRVAARVVFCTSDRAIVRVSFADGKEVEGYVHKSEVSNILYVDEDSLKTIFLPGRDYRCSIKRIDDHLRIVELSRKRYLLERNQTVQYGQVYTARSIWERGAKAYVHGDDVEGFILRRGRRPPLSRSLLRLFPAKIDHERAYIEFEVAPKT